MTTILVVDDSKVDLVLASQLLARAERWSVITAADGKQALELVERLNPDLVVTDLQMPEMNGLELVEVMRNEFPRIPVVLMTAAGSELIAVQALERGAASYVPKTQLNDSLVDTVRRLLESTEEQAHRDRLQRQMTEVAYSVDNDLNLVSALVQEVRELIRSRHLFEENECVRISTAIDEALANAYYHGNLDVCSDLKEEDAEKFYNLAAERRTQLPYADRQIHVRVRFTKDALEVVIRDDGKGFNPKSLPDPREPGFLERPCGRGVLLMRSFMDDISFNEVGNEVRLRKHVRRIADAALLGSESTL
ncbi:MAG: response regulator [Planctomycetaceae bacterium]